MSWFARHKLPIRTLVHDDISHRSKAFQTIVQHWWSGRGGSGIWDQRRYGSGSSTRMSSQFGTQCWIRGCRGRTCDSQKCQICTVDMKMYRDVPGMATAAWGRGSHHILSASIIFHIVPRLVMENFALHSGCSDATSRQSTLTAGILMLFRSGFLPSSPASSHSSPTASMIRWQRSSIGCASWKMQLTSFCDGH